MLMEEGSYSPLPGHRLQYRFCEDFHGRKDPAAYQRNTANHTNCISINGMISGI
jgi:hypothetical protein